MDIIIAAIIVLVMIVIAVVVAPTVKMALSIAPYLYTNTRCAAKTGMLLSKKIYDNMLAASYDKEMYALLEDTGYRHVVEHGHNFPTISPLLEKDLIATYRWLEHVVPEKLRPIIVAMQKRFEISEIKEAINQTSLGIPVNEVKYVSNTALRLKLEGATDYSSVINALEGSPYGELVTNNLLPPSALDTWYLEHVRDTIDAQDVKAAAPFKEYWKRQIDIANLRTTLRNTGAKLIAGGFILPEQLARAEDISQLPEVLAGTLYAGIEVHSVEEAEAAFQKELRTAAGAIAAKHPLYGGPMVRFIIEKELEIKNLNLIVKLKTEKFTQQEIEPMVL